MVATTVNAALKVEVSPGELADWIRLRETTDARKVSALSIFFLEVPLELQVDFLVAHNLDEREALELAETLGGPGQAIPLQRRSLW